MPYHTKKIEKPVMKPKKALSKRQKELMKEHKVHHTKAHMDMMKKLMLNHKNKKQLQSCTIPIKLLISSMVRNSL